MSLYEDEYGHIIRKEKKFEVIEPIWNGFQLIGDSQFLRFSEQMLNQKRQKRDGLAFLGLCVSGQKTSDLLKRVKENFHPTSRRVVLMIGTNDLLRNTHLSILRTNFRDLILHLIREAHVRKLLLLTIPPVPRLAQSEDHWNTLREYNEFIKEFHNGKDICVIDAYPKFIKSGDLSRSSLSLSRSSPLSTSQASLVSDSGISSPTSRSSFSSCTPSYTSNFGKIRTNLRIQLGDERRKIYITESDSDDDQEARDSSYSSGYSTPNNKRSSHSSGFATPTPKRLSTRFSYSSVEDDHNDRFCANESLNDGQYDEINLEYFERYFDSRQTRQDLIHLNNRGLHLIRKLIDAEIEG